MADTYDLLTLTEAKSVLRIGVNDTTLDTELARVITAVSRRIDEGIGPTVVRAVTSERHQGGRSSVELHHGPVQAVGSVLEYQGT
ncbi:MAG TPA: hypothetical protein VFV36_07840, partial [Candidatus Methylomirabilis sp.]|nr:hypothetical protein [Candidatus Methylomirabilis sp.]